MYVSKAKPKKITSKIVGLKELRENTEAYITAVGEGKSFTVIRRAKPIFKIIPVDEWGDEGVWETLIDFRELNPKGIPAGELLEILKRLKKKGL